MEKTKEGARPKLLSAGTTPELMIQRNQEYYTCLESVPSGAVQGFLGGVMGGLGIAIVGLYFTPHPLAWAMAGVGTMVVSAYAGVENQKFELTELDTCRYIYNSNFKWFPHPIKDRVLFNEISKPK